MPAIQNKRTMELITVDQLPVHTQGVWECGNKRFTDPSGSEYVAISTLSATPSVADFWELFTVEEEIAIRQKGTTDVLVSTWLRRLDDPRTTQVNLTMQSVIDTITYVAGTIPLASGRLDNILRGIQS